MARVLIVCGHVGIENITTDGLCLWLDKDASAQKLKGSTGSRGEREWTGHVGPLLADRLRARGVEVVVNDAIYDAGVYDRNYDLVISLHYQRDTPAARGFASAPNLERGYIGAVAQEKAQKWLARFVDQYELLTGIPVTQGRITTNMTDWYGWCYVPIDTPSVLVEVGHADLDAAVLYELGVPRIVGALDTITYEYLTADLGLTLGAPAPAPTPAPKPAGDPFPLASFPVVGSWPHEPAALDHAVATYSEGRAPRGWAFTLLTRASEAGIRADVAAALAMHETGRFRFDGNDPVYSAKSEWNNYGGIKTTDGTATAHFPTGDAGIRALVAHIAAYALPEHPTLWCEAADPRHKWVPHTNPPRLKTLADFGNGVWNTSDGYGSRVARHLAELRALVAAWRPPAEAEPDLHDFASALERIARALRGRAA